MHDVAVRNMLKVLDCGYQSKATQEIFLRDFFDIVKVPSLYLRFYTLH